MAFQMSVVDCSWQTVSHGLFQNGRYRGTEFTDVVGGVPADGLPQLDFLSGQSLDLSIGIDDAGPSRASAYIDTNEVFLLATRHVS